MTDRERKEIQVHEEVKAKEARKARRQRSRFEQAVPLIAGACVICLLLAIVVTIIAWDAKNVAQDSAKDAQDASETAAVASARAAEAKADQKALEQEIDRRRDQNCKVLESIHLQDVRNARLAIRRWDQTREFIRNIPPGSTDRLDQAVINGQEEQRLDLGAVWIEAAIDKAPPNCDVPGFGLKEPDPDIPPWPKDAGPKPRVPGEKQPG